MPRLPACSSTVVSCDVISAGSARYMLNLGNSAETVSAVLSCCVSTMFCPAVRAAEESKTQKVRASARTKVRIIRAD